MSSVKAYQSSLANMKPEAKEYFISLAQDQSVPHTKIAKLMNKAGHLNGRGGTFDYKNVSQIALYLGFRRKTGGPKKPYERGVKKVPVQVEFNLGQQKHKDERRALIDLIMEAKTISKTERAKAIEALME